MYAVLLGTWRTAAAEAGLMKTLCLVILTNWYLDPHIIDTHAGAGALLFSRLSSVEYHPTHSHGGTRLSPHLFLLRLLSPRLRYHGEALVGPCRCER